MNTLAPFQVVFGVSFALGLVLIAAVVAVQTVQARRRRRAVVARLQKLPRPQRPAIGRPPALVAALANLPRQTRTGGENGA